MDIAVASSARRQGQGCDEGDGWVVFGPEKVELDLRFVRERRNQDDFVLVNRAASRLPDDAAKNLKRKLYSEDGDQRSVACVCLGLRLVRFAICVFCVLAVCVLGVLVW